MKKITSLILSLGMCCLLLTSNASAYVLADMYSGISAIDCCTQRVRRFNEKYGTNFCLDTSGENNFDPNDIISFYSGMTDEEFEEYFLDLKSKYEIWLKSNNDIELTADGVEISLDSSTAYSGVSDDKSIMYSPNVPETQYLFYNASSNANSLVMHSTVNYSGGWGVYMSIDGIDSYVDQFPAYIAEEYSKTVNSYQGYCSATLNFYCKVYVGWGAYVSDSERTITATFTAGKGDLYAYTSL